MDTSMRVASIHDFQTSDVLLVFEHYYH